MVGLVGKNNIKESRKKKERKKKICRRVQLKLEQDVENF